ncbi:MULTISPECIES: putative bifunctional diguanylate cyclase/phosphodiesterase [unclassified Sphingobium]|uniref:putative bifunctional diguanylate cyclase/phosphodiesterase n=1 Tax=unclassified Sphingobium TaxID=2611147 RepID=UPI0022249B49|nr:MULTISPECIES: EAL domain-containing protein [unclassified Sphingobium]
MESFYHLVVVDQQIRGMLIIVAICGSGILTATAILGHTFNMKSQSIRRAWLVMAGLVTGVSFSAILLTGVAALGARAGTTTGPDMDHIIVEGVASLLFMTALVLAWRGLTGGSAASADDGQLAEALDELAHVQAHHRAYVELNPQIAWMADAEGRITEIGPLWAEQVGLDLESGLGYGWTQAVHPDDLPTVQALWADVVKNQSDAADVRYRIRMANGMYRWYRARARPHRGEDGKVLAWYGTLEDIHDHVIAETALRQSEERYRLAAEAGNDVIWDCSLPTGITTWSGAYKKVLGYPELDQATHFDWWIERIHPDDRERVLANQRRALESGQKFWLEEFRFRTAKGTFIDTKARSVIVRGDKGVAVRLVGSILDITKQKQAQAELNWAAYHDHLTRLPNRALFGVRIQAAIDAACDSGDPVALMILDLNGFKEMNDSLGHAAGDRVLVEVARRLSSCIPEGATAARLGGDEFAIILPGLSAADEYRPVADALKRCFEVPVQIEELRIPVSFSVGVAVWPRDGFEPGDLLIAADLALYAAKADMPGSVREFSPSLKVASERRTRMLVMARAGLDEDRIVPFYQPKVNLQTGQIDGWEALLRVAENSQVLPPAAIEAAFSDAEMSVRLTDRMICGIFADIARWRADGLEPGRIAVNVSAGDFRAPSLPARLEDAARAHRQGLAQIDIEVTETVLIGQLGPEVARMLEELRGLGVMVALDDFGTGYASLSHLQQFPVDVIKIDKSFIDRIEDSTPGATAVIDAVLQMARRLGMQTVAEGVETIAQARYLRARGCTLGQGFLFSKPVPASQVPSLLRGKAYGHWEFGGVG